MAINIVKVKSVTARTLWSIEAMLCQNVLDLGEMTDEEEQLYYERMAYYFKDFFARFEAFRKGEEVPE